MDLQKGQNVQELLNLLSEHKPDKAQDLSALLFYVDGMERKFDAVLHELQAVKAQLAEVQESSHPLKKALSAFVQGMENRIDQMKERLFEIKESIANTAAKMVDDVKQAGISALDKTVDFLVFVRDLPLCVTISMLPRRTPVRRLKRLKQWDRNSAAWAITLKM